MSFKEKIQGVLGCTAIGDAMGAATENLTFQQIREMFGKPLTEFVKPGETAFALGNEAGEITDDFSQIYFIAKEILKNNGKLDKGTVIRAMLAWSEVSKWFDRFAGPTTRTAIAMYKDSSLEMKPLPGAVTVDYASKATNGSAMKIAPAAILNPNNIEGAIEDAVLITRVTHDNSLAISGACAVAAASAAGFAEKATMEEILTAGLYGAVRGETIGKNISRDVAGPSVVKRIELAFRIVNGEGNKEDKLQKLSSVVGSGLHISEAVPCAFGIAALNLNDPLQAVFDAVNIGYDTDTIAAITGTMVGALMDIHDEHFIKLYEEVQKANRINIVQLSEELANIVE
nr:ADP-ribosylglycohydrolase family protein [uncultured Anaerostipes sp.]